MVSSFYLFAHETKWSIDISFLNEISQIATLHVLCLFFLDKCRCVESFIDMSTRAHALAEINQMKTNGHDIQAAVASKTDEPSWAQFCMQHLAIPTTTNTNTSTSSNSSNHTSSFECDASNSTTMTNNNNGFVSMRECFMVGSKSLIEIAFDNKQYHFKQLKVNMGN